MKDEFLKQIFQKQQQKQKVPSNTVIASWATRLIYNLYPALSADSFDSPKAIGDGFSLLKTELVQLLDGIQAFCDVDHNKASQHFFDRLPEIYRVLNTDITAIGEGDPAATCEFEVVRAYPGFYALCFYRIAHELYKLKVPLLPRILTEYAHSKTGIDIHPGAEIGEHFMMDHGTGIVIGQTSVIGNNVKMYQGVTLGGMSIHKKMKNQKRHPTIEDNVIIYAGATILGGETIVGFDSVIGGNVWLTQSVPPGSLVVQTPKVTIVKNKYLKTHA